MKIISFVKNYGLVMVLSTFGLFFLIAFGSTIASELISADFPTWKFNHANWQYLNKTNYALFNLPILAVIAASLGMGSLNLTKNRKKAYLWLLIPVILYGALVAFYMR